MSLMREISQMESRRSSLNASPTDEPIGSTNAARSSSHVPQYRPAKTHPKIKIEPNCLVFPPPHFRRCIQNAISIYNVSKQPCVFKMRSQNPERYVAKPHVAIVAPESATRIFVTLRDMNTLGMKDLPEDTQDRFRLSLKLYDSKSVDPSLSAKELWNVLTARGTRVDHEQDLIAYFTKRDTPVGGLVTFFPPTYIPVTSSAASKPGSPISDAPQGSAKGGGAGTAARASNGKADTAAGQRENGSGKKGSAGDGGAARLKGGAGSKPALWVGLVFAAVMVLSVAVVMGRMWGRMDSAVLTAPSPQPPAASEEPACQHFAAPAADPVKAVPPTEQPQVHSAQEHTPTPPSHQQHRHQRQEHQNPPQQSSHGHVPS